MWSGPKYSPALFSIFKINATAAAAALNPTYPADPKNSKIFEKSNRKFWNNSTMADLFYLKTSSNSTFYSKYYFTKF